MDITSVFWMRLDWRRAFPAPAADFGLARRVEVGWFFEVLAAPAGRFRLAAAFGDR